MLVAVLIAAVFLPVMLAAVLLAARRYVSRRSDEESLSSVSQQHFELLQGGEINPQLIEAAKERFQAMLDRGDDAAVEARLRPGESFVVQVRALAELGTDAAGRILERQLGRRLSSDRIEQNWYRIDLANGLRQLNRSESLPHLLRCVEDVVEAPMGPVFAAETFCFLGFNGYLTRPGTRLGRAALVVAQRVLDGFRVCLPPHVAIEGRLGEAIETIWDNRPRPANAAVVRALHAAMRYLRRKPAALAMLADEPAEREAFQWQMARVEGLETAIVAELSEAKSELPAQLPSARGVERRDILHSLDDLRVDAAEVLLPLVADESFAEMELALGALRWSRDSRVGDWMRAYARRHVDVEARAVVRRMPFRRRDRVSASFPYEAVLHALRGQPSEETEVLLAAAARDRDPIYRRTAVSSLGWWEPANDALVIGALEVARRDAVADVRRAARAALARLGERSALQWFRQALVANDAAQQHDAIHFVAAEGLSLLWPDLDGLLDSSNPEVVIHAREALAILSEEMSA